MYMCGGGGEIVSFCMPSGGEYQVLLVQKVDNTIHWINNAIGFPNIYLLDSDFSGRSCSKVR